MSTEPKGNDTKIAVGIGKALPGKLEELAANRNISISKRCEILLDDWIGSYVQPKRPEKK